MPHARLDEEHDNLRAALRWWLVHDVQAAARLAAAIRYFWNFQGEAVVREVVGDRFQDGTPGS